MAALTVGSIVLVSYGEGGPRREFHQRLICGVVRNSEFVVCTRDFDFYVENISLDNNNLTAIRFYNADGSLPPGVDEHRLVAFRDITPRPAEPVSSGGAVVGQCGAPAFGTTSSASV